MIEQHESILEERLIERSDGNEDDRLLETLLDGHNVLIEDLESSETGQSSTLDSVWNLTNVILGAGMYALPRVYGGLGFVGGTLLIALVAAMTYATIAIMCGYSESVNRWTYASTMDAAWGHKAAAAVHAAVIAGCIGFVALYLIITCDVLLGNKEFTGIIADLFPQFPDPLPWYLNRTAFLTYVALLSAPLLSAHTLHGMALTSAVSVGCSASSMLCLLLLWAGAAFKRKLAPFRLWPDLSFFGDHPAVIATHLIATLPVVMTAFVCQMSIHPIARDLHSYTPTKMRGVSAWSLTICGFMYAATGASGFSTFGDVVEGDVLSNIQPETVAAILDCDDTCSLALVTVMKSFVAMAMLTSIPINLWPLREEVMGLLVAALKGKQPSRTAFYSVTYLSLGFIWAISVCIQSAYSMIGLVGATCGIALAFIFPGMLALKSAGLSGSRTGGWTLIVLGVILMAIGVASTMLGVS